MVLVGEIVNECIINFSVSDFSYPYSIIKRSRGYGMKYKIIYDPTFRVYILITSSPELFDGGLAKVISQAQVDMIEEAERNAKRKLSTSTKKKLYH